MFQPEALFTLCEEWEIPDRCRQVKCLLVYEMKIVDELHLMRPARAIALSSLRGAEMCMRLVRGLASWSVGLHDVCSALKLVCAAT